LECVGAHPDDIETGSAGFLIQSLRKGIDCYVLVFSDCEDRPGNHGISKEFEKSMSALSVQQNVLQHIPTTQFPNHHNSIRQCLEKYKEEYRPELIVTLSLNSIHQDHATVARECERVFRYQSVISYEDFKSTPRFNPNLYVPLSKEDLQRKVEIAMLYKTQHRRFYFNAENVEALARFRGVVAGVPFAEAYEVIRLINLK